MAWAWFALIPDLVWALLFVAGIGLGPTAGTLALAVSYTALLGRVYADVFDETDVRPLEALEALGATRLQVFLFGILPQSRALLTSYTLYSFECSVRSAAVLGFVGAGGLGYEISLSMRLFEFPQVLTLMACFVLLLFLVDLASRGLRARLKANPETSPDSAAGGVFQQHLRRRWLIGIARGGDVASLALSGGHYAGQPAPERHGAQPGPLCSAVAVAGDLRVLLTRSRPPRAPNHQHLGDRDSFRSGARSAAGAAGHTSSGGPA